MTRTVSTAEPAFIAEPEDRIFTPIDPLWRNARRRFTTLIVIACVLHASLLAFLLLRDHAPQQVAVETPVEVVVIPPPEPKPPAPKEEQKPPPQPKEKPKPRLDKAATDTPPPPNKEQIRRDQADQATQSPLNGKPQPNAEMKPVPNQPKAAPDAAPQTAEKTAAPDMPEDKPDAEPVNKAEPIKDPKPVEKQKPAKEKTPVTRRLNSSLAQEFAALEQSPHYTIATPSKPSPVSGGHCNTSPYLCTLFGLIMRQQHYPETARAMHIEGKVVVAFWVDERGDLVHQAIYRSSGHSELDNEAVSAIKRAAPFPPPPPGTPHGFIAQMEFPPK